MSDKKSVVSLKGIDVESITSEKLEEMRHAYAKQEAPKLVDIFWKLFYEELNKAIVNIEDIIVRMEKEGRIENRYIRNELQKLIEPKLNEMGYNIEKIYYFRDIHIRWERNTEKKSIFKKTIKLYKDPMYLFFIFCNLIFFSQLLTIGGFKLCLFAFSFSSFLITILRIGYLYNSK